MWYTWLSTYSIYMKYPNNRENIAGFGTIYDIPDLCACSYHSSSLQDVELNPRKFNSLCDLRALVTKIFIHIFCFLCCENACLWKQKIGVFY